MTLPVPNLTSPLVDKLGKLIPPWNSWFQQLTQKAPAVQSVTANPFTANANGNLIIIGATTIILTRGQTSINLTGQKIIPISISDTVTWTGVPTSVQFLGA